MTGGGATGGSSSAAAEGTAVDALGRAVGDLRMGTMGTPLDPPPGELGAAEDVRHRQQELAERK